MCILPLSAARGIPAASPAPPDSPRPTQSTAGPAAPSSLRAHPPSSQPYEFPPRSTAGPPHSLVRLLATPRRTPPHRAPAGDVAVPPSARAPSEMAACSRRQSRAFHRRARSAALGRWRSKLASVWSTPFRLCSKPTNSSNRNPQPDLLHLSPTLDLYLTICWLLPWKDKGHLMLAVVPHHHLLSQRALLHPQPCQAWRRPPARTTSTLCCSASNTHSKYSSWSGN